jgi:hypothetical protein
MAKDRVHLPGHQHDRGRGRATPTGSSAFPAPANPVPLAVMRTASRPSSAAPDVNPLDRLRREPGGVIRRGRNGGKNGGTATAPKKKTPQEEANEKKPQTGQTYTLDEARTQLKAFDHSQANVPFRKQIAKAWGDYIFANFAQLKAGVIRDTYKSSFDKGHDDEFSVSQEIDGIPEIVIHAHMDKDGKPKPGNGVHWKWADGEKVAESYELSATLVAKLLEAAAAKKEWDTNGKKKYAVTIPTTATPGTPGSAGTAGTGGPPTGGTGTATATVSLPTTPKT